MYMCVYIYIRKSVCMHVCTCAAHTLVWKGGAQHI